MTIILRPSQPWPYCPGSPRFVERLRNEGKIPKTEGDSEVAALGTRAHYFAEAKVKATFYPESARSYWQDEADKIADTLPENYLENASKYVRCVTEVLFGRDQLIEWGIETKVPIWYEPNHKGTVDFWWYEKPVLSVLDYKSGRVEVVPQGNTQLVSYALGLCDARGLQPEKVRLGIIQPFVGGFRGHEPTWWEVSWEELSAFRQELSWLAREAREPLVRSRLIPGEKQCRFCPAKALCPAVEEQSRASMGVSQEVESLTEVDLFRVLDAARVYRDFMDAVEDRIRDLDDDVLKKYGWRKQKGARKFSWLQDESEVAVLLREIGVDAYKTSLKTPSMVRDELGSDDLLEGLYQVDYNRPTLKRMK